MFSRLLFLLLLLLTWPVTSTAASHSLDATAREGPWVLWFRVTSDPNNPEEKLHEDKRPDWQHFGVFPTLQACLDIHQEPVRLRQHREWLTAVFPRVWHGETRCWPLLWLAPKR